MENKELKYKCEKCNYLTNYKSSYDKHLKSELHLLGKRKERSDKKNKKCEETFCKSSSCKSSSCFKIGRRRNPRSPRQSRRQSRRPSGRNERSRQANMR